MSHTYYSILAHCVFSTKERRPFIPADMKDKLWPYIAGIARQNRFKAIAVGGMPDHVHVLVSLPTSMAIAKAVQLIKGGSSKWINDHLKRRTFPGRMDMELSPSAYRSWKIRCGISAIRSAITQRWISPRSGRKCWSVTASGHLLMRAIEIARLLQPSPKGD